MNEDIFNRSVRINQNIKRNVVFIPSSMKITKSLLGDDNFHDVLKKATQRGRMYLNESEPFNDFYYTAAIAYPFKTEPYMSSRYSDGSYPVWYGSKKIETSIYETAYHTVQHIKAIDDYQQEAVFVRKRTVYNVWCDTILIDLLGKHKKKPKLLGDDYHFTQGLGKIIHDGGYPGLQSPSARHTSGVNVSVFKQHVLSKPNIDSYLTYKYNTNKSELMVFQGEQAILSLAY